MCTHMHLHTNSVGARAQPKPMKLKRINKLKDHHIVKVACGTHTSAMISKDGKLFMFGSLDEDLTEKSSGVVAGLLGVPVSQVAIGRSHTCVLTQHGTVFTFGNNTYGQCGRSFVASKNVEGKNHIIILTDIHACMFDVRVSCVYIYTCLFTGTPL